MGPKNDGAVLGFGCGCIDRGDECERTRWIGRAVEQVARDSARCLIDNRAVPGQLDVLPQISLQVLREEVPRHGGGLDVSRDVVRVKRQPIHIGTTDHNVALIVADMEKVRQFADEKGLSGSNPELLQLPEIREQFKNQVGQFSTTFKNFERIEDFSLLDEEWNPDNGLLTPTMKIKRSVIEEKFKENITSLYA